MKLKEITNIDLEKYKSQKNVRRLQEHEGGFEKIVFATDQDLDGFHIRGLLSGFIHKYLPQLRDSVYMLQTPVIAVTKNGKVTRWTYNLNDKPKLVQGERSDYKKGLGSWDPEDLNTIISKDGLDTMVQQVDFNQSDDVLDDWLGDDAAPRKEYIQKNNFNIAKA